MSTKPQPNASQTKPAESAPSTDALAALEQANASLAARVAELTADLEAREAALADMTARAERAERESSDTHATLRVTRADRDELMRRLDARRESGAPLAFDITALVELHRVVGGDSDRYLATARRLGDALVASHAPPASR